MKRIWRKPERMVEYMEIEFSVKINVVTGRGYSRQDWIDQFTREIKYEYPHSEVRVVK